MDAEPLFLQRCEQIAILLQSHNEVELLHLGGLLRQLIMDKYSLLDTANKNRIKPVFYVGVLGAVAEQRKPLFAAIEDGLDPETGRPGRPTARLTRDDFLKHIVMMARDNDVMVTVKDVISHAANVAGGIHHDPRPKTDPLSTFGKFLQIGGYPVGLRQLKAIARVTLRALQPVIEDVKTNLGAKPPLPEITPPDRK